MKELDRTPSSVLSASVEVDDPARLLPALHALLKLITLNLLLDRLDKITQKSDMKIDRVEINQPC